jgi:hypothetical protein
VRSFLPFVSFNLYYKAPTLELAPHRVLTQLEQLVSDFHCDGVDQLSLQHESAKSALQAADEAGAVVVKRMERDSIEQGPAFAFEFKMEEQRIRGVVKKQYIQFEYPDCLSEASLGALKSLMRTLVPLHESIQFDR